jgi:hypothetical protein
MYKVFTPAGVIETDYKTALEYQRMGCLIEKIESDEFSPEEIFGEV